MTRSADDTAGTALGRALRVVHAGVPFVFPALVSTTALLACVDRPTREPPPGLPRLTTQAALAAIDSQARTERSPEAVPAWLALAIPGFAGFAFDTGNGDLIVWIKDVRNGAAARAAVQHYLRTTYRGWGGRAGPNPPARIQAADFDFLELGSVRDRVNAALANEPSLQSVGIGVLTNRVEVGVNAGAADRVAALLTRAGVPLKAVRITAAGHGLELGPYPIPAR